MASKKTGTTSTRKGKKTQVSTARKKNSTARAKSNASRRKAPERGQGFQGEIILVIMLLVCFLLLISVFGVGGLIGAAVGGISFGIIGWLSFVFPILLFIVCAILIAKGPKAEVIKKIIAGIVFLACVCAIMQFIFEGYEAGKTLSDYFNTCKDYKSGGGVIGGALLGLTCHAFGSIGGMVVLTVIMIVCLIIITQKSFFGLFYNMADHFSQAGEMRRQRDEELEPERERRRELREKERELRRQKRLSRLDEAIENTEESRKEVERANEERKKRREANARQRARAAEKERKAQEALKARTHPDLELDQLSLDLEIDDGSFDDEDTLHVPGFLEGTLLKKSSDKKASSSLAEADGEEPEEQLPVDNDIPENSADKEAEPTIKPAKGRAASKEAAKAASPAESMITSSPRQGVTEFKIHRTLPSEEGTNEEPAETQIETQIENQIDSQMVSHTQTSAEPSVKSSPARGVSQFSEQDPSESDLSDSGESADEMDAYADLTDPLPSRTQLEGPRAAAKAKAQERAREEAAMPSAASARKANPKSSQEEIQEHVASVADQVSQAGPAKEKPYRYPPVELLKKGDGKSSGDSDEYLEKTARKLKETLDNFGVDVEITDVSCGPTVTRYELKPKMGVKVSKIVGLSDDIKLNLAAPDIRIEAPIPGKAAVGIEVPNKTTTAVMLRDLIDSPEFARAKSRLSFAAGKDIGGKIIVSDIAKMPHVLIAGATGSGKSVCINTLIISILYKSSPEEVKLIMIDPKVVELSVYNGIPHLLIPVVTDPKKASGALNWAVKEMTDRYNTFAEFGVRNIGEYNKKIQEMAYTEEERPKKMYQIVVIVDELADLMMVAPGEVEDAICRLAQLARAAGIHLVIATQRPSVNVITGLIKANMPSRIAFSVTSGVDSRTILDMVGAEKLLGKGDMLFYPQGYTKPQRLQGAFVSDDEVSAVVRYVSENNSDRASNTAEIEQQVMNSVSAGGVKGGLSGDSDQDEYFEEAGRFIIEKEKASIGMLQRALKIGFNRASRIMEQLCDAGVVGPEEGTKPRKVLMTMDQFEDYLSL